MFPQTGTKAPRSLTVLLVTVVAARLGIAFFVGSSLTTALAWATLLGGLSVAALSGRRTAATMLAYLCIVLGVDTLLQLLTVDVPTAHCIAAILWASLIIGAGTYILLSSAVKRFYAPEPKA